MSRWWVRAGGSALAVVLLLTLLPLDIVWRAVRVASPLAWMAAVVIFIAGHALNALKLYVLVGRGKVTAAACLRAHFTAIAANLGLPGVVGGELVRVGYLAPTAGTARVAIAAVADRIVDALVLVALVTISARVAGVPVGAVSASHGTSGARRWILVAIVALLAVGLCHVLRKRGAGTALRDAWNDFRKRPFALVVAIAISAGVQSVFVLTLVWLASPLGVSLGLAPWFLAWTASKLSALLPISIGGIGVREAALVSVLAAYGAAPEAVLATGILWEGAIIVGSLFGFFVLQLVRR